MEQEQENNSAGQPQPEQPTKPDNSEAVANIINNQRFDTWPATAVFREANIEGRAQMMVAFKQWLYAEAQIKERAEQVAEQQNKQGLQLVGERGSLVNYTEEEKKEMTKTPFIFRLGLEGILLLFGRDPNKPEKPHKGRIRNQPKKKAGD